MKKTKIILSLSKQDIVTFFRIHAKHLGKLSACLVVLAVLYATLSTPSYESLASFKSKKDGADDKSSIQEIFSLSSADASSSSVVLFNSRPLLDPAIEQTGLQGVIEPSSLIKLFSQNLLKNLRLEWAFFSLQKDEVLNPLSHQLRLSNVVYQGSKLRKIRLKFSDYGRFQAFSTKDNQKLGEGKLNAPFQFDQGTLTVNSSANPSSLPKEVTIKLLPLDIARKKVLKKLAVDPDPASDCVVLLAFSNPDQQVAAAFLNNLMAAYKAYMQSEKNEKTEIQLNYLAQRYQTVTHSFQNELDAYASRMKADAENVGFLDSATELRDLTGELKLKERELTKVEAEITRLSSSITDNYLYCDPSFNIEAIRDLLQKKRFNQQKLYTLELALKGSSLIPESPKNSLQKSYQEAIETLSAQKEEAIEAIAQLETNKDIILSQSPLFESELIRKWTQDYNQQLQNLSSSDAQESLSQYRSFYHLKHNLLHFFKENQNLLNIQIKNIAFKASSFEPKNASTHKNLEPQTSEALFQSHTASLEKVSQAFNKCSYVYGQLLSPDFPINALSGFLEDETSKDVIKRASLLYLDLQDRSNFTKKERERKVEQINIYKQSLLLHLKRSMGLLQLEKSNLENSIQSLQFLTLNSCKQQNSILDASLDNFVQTRLETLEKEKNHLLKQVNSIKEKMSFTPFRWARQQSLKVKTEVNRAILEEVSKLVESKNVESNLSVVESKPLEKASLAINPNPPFILFKALLGYLLALSFFFMYACFKLNQNGPYLSEDLLGNALLGKLALKSGCNFDSLPIPSKLPENDLETLRQTCRSLDLYEKTSSVLITLNECPNFIPNLCQILKLNKKSSFVLHFTENSQSNSMQGFLKNSSSIQKNRFGCDVVLLDAKEDFLVEALHQDEFKEKIETFKNVYDVFILSFEKTPSPSLHAAMKQYTQYSIICFYNQLATDVQNISDSETYFLEYYEGV